MEIHQQKCQYDISNTTSKQENILIFGQIQYNTCSTCAPTHPFLHCPSLQTRNGETLNKPKREESVGEFVEYEKKGCRNIFYIQTSTNNTKTSTFVLTLCVYIDLDGLKHTDTRVNKMGKVEKEFK